MENLGFIGGGQMAEALIKGVLAANLYRAEQILVAEPHGPRREVLRKNYGVTVEAEAGSLWDNCEVVVLAVKPRVVGVVLEQGRERIGRRHLLISIAAGISLAFMEERLAPAEVRIVRVMPNTPALVLAAASALSAGRYAGADDLAAARRIFAAVGEAVILEEKLLDAVTGLSGSGPAYVFTFLEALIDAGVKVGLSREVAEILARRTILGSVQLALAAPEKNPAALRAMVTSPGGTTIAGLHVLERGGFRGLIMDAVEAATRRSSELGQE